MCGKLIKDPVHGYIEIDEDFIETIDTIIFQRLKRLQQTSYRVLYPSASHDRFVHSIGVYYLGKLAFDAIVKNTSSDIMLRSGDFKTTIEKWREPFLAACLLHDVGHAPFSHTYEYFYKKDKLITQLKEALKDVTKNEDIHYYFDNDLLNDTTAAPHEIMSALVVLKKHEELRIPSSIDKENYDFIVRAITGTAYGSNLQDGKDEREIKNALINILNSQLIDVDKLDYILRESISSGYMNVEMDLPRLMSSFVLCRKRFKYDDNDGIIWPMYKQSAQSVVESVFTGKNNQKRWIQSHNAVVYEVLLMQTAIQKILKRNDIECENFFCYDAIVGEGIEIVFNSSKRKVIHLADEDIICLMKEYIGIIPEVDEYFDRNNRKVAIWKTHSEFIALFNNISEQAFDHFSYFMSNQNRLIHVNRDTFDDMLKKIDADKQGRYKFFFKKVGFDSDKPTSDIDEFVFVKYDAASFRDRFDAENIYILFKGGKHIPFSKIIKQIKEQQTSEAKDTRGFFVFYKPRFKEGNRWRIGGDRFLEEYRDKILREPSKRT